MVEGGWRGLASLESVHVKEILGCGIEIKGYRGERGVGKCKMCSFVEVLRELKAISCGREDGKGEGVARIKIIHV